MNTKYNTYAQILIHQRENIFVFFSSFFFRDWLSVLLGPLPITHPYPNISYQTPVKDCSYTYACEIVIEI